MNANTPSQIDAPTAPTTAATQTAENRVSKKAARRSNAGRARTQHHQDERQQERLLVVEPFEQRGGDAEADRADRQ